MRVRLAVLLVLGSTLAGCAGGGSSQTDQSDEATGDGTATVTLEVSGMS
jgi:hypothetical protein